MLLAQKPSMSIAESLCESPCPPFVRPVGQPSHWYPVLPGRHALAAPVAATTTHRPVQWCDARAILSMTCLLCQAQAADGRVCVASGSGGSTLRFVPPVGRFVTLTSAPSAPPSHPCRCRHPTWASSRSSAWRPWRRSHPRRRRSAPAHRVAERCRRCACEPTLTANGACTFHTILTTVCIFHCRSRSIYAGPSHVRSTEALHSKSRH